MTRTPLSERDQHRALLLVALAAGCDRVAKVLEARGRYLSLTDLFPNHGRDINIALPVVGAFLAAGLVHLRGPRLTAIVAAAMCTIGALLGAAGLGGGGGIVAALGTGAFTVGSIAFAAKLLLPEGEERPSPSRFAGMAYFILARAGFMDLGAFVSAWIHPSHAAAQVIAAVLDLAAIAAILLALPRAAVTGAELPAQPVYRAPSAMNADEPPPPPRPAMITTWPAVRPFVAPAFFFTMGATAAAFNGSGAGSALETIAATGGAIYFFIAWQRRRTVAAVAFYARGLGLAAVGWLIIGGTGLIGTAWIGGVVASVGSAAMGMSLGFVALAGRGRRTGLWLAWWSALSAIVSWLSSVFGRAGGPLLVVGLIALALAVRLNFRATEAQSRFE